MDIAEHERRHVNICFQSCRLEGDRHQIPTIQNSLKRSERTQKPRCLHVRFKTVQLRNSFLFFGSISTALLNKLSYTSSR